MMSDPTFSIVVPTYNYAEFLGVALDSVLEQGRDDVEIIVVDDASTDATPEVMERYPSVTYLRLSENVGPGGAWATGLGEARGRYVAKLDADDWQLPGWFEAMEEAFGSDPGVGLVAGSAYLWRDGEVLLDRVTRGTTLLSPEQLRRRLLDQFFFRMPATCLRADACRGQAPPRDDLRLPHDWEFFLRATRGWKAVLLDQSLAVYRIHGASLTLTSEFENRLYDDYVRLHAAITDPDDSAHLEGAERMRMIGGMARGYLGSVGPRLDLRDVATVRRHAAVALAIARWGGPSAVARTARYVLYGAWQRLVQSTGNRWASVPPGELLPAGYDRPATQR